MKSNIIHIHSRTRLHDRSSQAALARFIPTAIRLVNDLEPADAVALVKDLEALVEIMKRRVALRKQAAAAGTDVETPEDR